MTGNTPEETLEPQRQAALHELLADLPEPYADRYAAIQKIRAAFHQEMAAALRPALNDHIACQPQNTPDERQGLAAWINQQLRQIGLAAKCSRTGKPANIVADRDSYNHDITRFRFSIHDDNGKHIHRGAMRHNLPPLELTEHMPRIESFAKSYRDAHGR